MSTSANILAGRVQSGKTLNVPSLNKNVTTPQLLAFMLNRQNSEANTSSNSKKDKKEKKKKNKKDKDAPEEGAETEGNQADHSHEETATETHPTHEEAIHEEGDGEVEDGHDAKSEDEEEESASHEIVDWEHCVREKCEQPEEQKRSLRYKTDKEVAEHFDKLANDPKYQLDNDLNDPRMLNHQRSAAARNASAAAADDSKCEDLSKQRKQMRNKEKEILANRLREREARREEQGLAPLDPEVAKSLKVIPEHDPHCVGEEKRQNDGKMPTTEQLREEAAREMLHRYGRTGIDLMEMDKEFQRVMGETKRREAQAAKSAKALAKKQKSGKALNKGEKGKDGVEEDNATKLKPGQMRLNRRLLPPYMTRRKLQEFLIRADKSESYDDNTAQLIFTGIGRIVMGCTESTMPVRHLVPKRRKTDSEDGSDEESGSGSYDDDDDEA